MKITIKKEVFKKFPKLKVAFIVIKDIDNKKKLKESQHLLNEIVIMSRVLFRKDTVKTHHFISPWAVAQEGFGEKAKHYQTAVERLLTDILKRKSVKGDNSAVNLNNYLSLKHLVPMGIDDLQKIEGNITFQLAKGTEKINRLKKLKKGALYYGDDKKIIATKLDYWKNPKTKPGKKSTDLLVHIEVIPPAKNPRGIAKEYAELVKDFCGGKTKVVVLDSKKSSMSI